MVTPEVRTGLPKGFKVLHRTFFFRSCRVQDSRIPFCPHHDPIETCRMSGNWDFDILCVKNAVVQI